VGVIDPETLRDGLAAGSLAGGRQRSRRKFGRNKDQAAL
jgi:hypothetical protein